MATWSKDFHLALRMLRRRPGFAAMVLVILALGIGTTTALFGVFRTVFLQPLPLPASDRLVFVMEQIGFGCCGPASGPDYVDWVVRQRAFAGMGILSPGGVTLTGGGAGEEAERVLGTAASASVFELLGVPPLLGRPFTVQDQVQPSVVLLSYGLWQRRYGGRRDVLGATLEIDGKPYAIVGVMPKGFDVPSPWLGTLHHQLYTPFDDAQLTRSRGSHSYPVVARLAPRATLPTAQADMDRIMRELAREYPQTNGDRSTRIFTAHDYMYGYVGRELAYILGAAALVLLIACGNVAALQLARTAARETELAVRAALGATRGALARLLFSESVLMAVLGGLGGVLVSVAAVRGLRALLPPSMPRLADAHVDAWTLAFAVGVSAVTALAFGVIPALIASRGDLVAGIREGGAGAVAPRRERIRDYFIVGQIALGLVLANGAALLVRSWVRLRGEDPGFKAAGVLTVSVRPAGARYEDVTTLSTYHDRVLERVRALPGVRTVGTVSRLPLAGGTNGNVLVEGMPPRTSEDRGPLVEVTSVTGDYFAAMGIRLLRGRTLLPADSDSVAPGVVINDHFAGEAWPGKDPLGKRFSFSDNPPQWITVVGVVDDVRQWGPEQPPVSQAYFPLARGWSSSGYVIVRAQGDPAALAGPVRRAILSVDPTQAPSDIQTMSARVEGEFAQRRFYTILIGLFAVAALLLAGAGVYGTVSYYVTRRTRELGIRIVLGAAGTAIVGQVVGRGARLAAWGVVIGLVGVWATTSLVAKLLYGIGPLDPWTLAAGCAVLASVAIGASALPARRAVRVPPALALRAE
jgi:putative ABC transport system permease protein